ncbi:hypothetical protein AKO1_007666 [Acrasis kona]|uniref:TLDc domain-containing protein n=1 Tax=Acrasis kona TaxID=1008807 RepID=A0AAW2YRM9_9EUKA
MNLLRRASEIITSPIVTEKANQEREESSTHKDIAESPSIPKKSTYQKMVDWLPTVKTNDHQETTQDNTPHIANSEEQQKGFLNKVTAWMGNSPEQEQIEQPIENKQTIEPEKQLSPPHVSKYVEHEVQEDVISVTSMTFKLDMDLSEFCSVNHLDMQDDLYKGQTILINNPEYEHVTLPSPVSPVEQAPNSPVQEIVEPEQESSASKLGNHLLSGIQSVGTITKSAVIGTVDLTKNAVVGTVDLTKSAVDKIAEGLEYIVTPTTASPPTFDTTQQPVVHHRKMSDASKRSSLQNAPPHKIEFVNTTQGSVAEFIKIENISKAIPHRYHNQDWRLIYSTREHGTSLRSLYDHCKDRQEPCVLIVQSSDSNIFGAFLSETPKVWDRYYGNGECFLFKLKPFTVYKWNRKSHNEMFIFSTYDGLTIGGSSNSGDLDSGNITSSGLWLDRELLKGSSYACETFGTDECISAKEDFDVHAVEVWGFESTRSRSNSASSAGSATSLGSPISDLIEEEHKQNF